MGLLLQKKNTILSKIVKKIELCVEVFRERLHGFLGTHPVYEGVIYTEEEEKVIERSVEVLQDFFETSPGESLVGEDFESRCEAIEDLGKELIECYGLEDVKIVITDSEEIFPGAAQHSTQALQSWKDKAIYINANFLRVNDKEVLEQMVSSILHELRHFMQDQVMIMENTYGVPFGRRHIWRLNARNYIDPAMDREGYWKQPIEVDARNFANRIWRRAYGHLVQ